jgi:hypothetical protein
MVILKFGSYPKPPPPPPNTLFSFTVEHCISSPVLFCSPGQGHDTQPNVHLFSVLVTLCTLAIQHHIYIYIYNAGRPLWSSIRVPNYRPRGSGSIPSATNVLRRSGSGTGPTQPREYN